MLRPRRPGQWPPLGECGVIPMGQHTDPGVGSQVASPEGPCPQGPPVLPAGLPCRAQGLSQATREVRLSEVRAPSGTSAAPNSCPAPKSGERPLPPPQCAVPPATHDAGRLPTRAMTTKGRSALTACQPLDSHHVPRATKRRVAHRTATAAKPRRFARARRCRPRTRGPRATWAEAKHRARGHGARRAELAVPAGGLSRARVASRQKPPGGTCAACPPPRSGVPLPPSSHLSRWSQWPRSSREWGRRRGGDFSRPGCSRPTAQLLVSGAGGGVQPPPSAPHPAKEEPGRQAAPSLAGWGLGPGKEDAAKITRPQAVSPGNKAASHWLLVTSPLLRITWDRRTSHLCMCLTVGAGPAGGAGTQTAATGAQDGAGAGLSVSA